MSLHVGEETGRRRKMSGKKVAARVTAGDTCEWAAWRSMLRPGEVYRPSRAGAAGRAPGQRAVAGDPAGAAGRRRAGAAGGQRVLIPQSGLEVAECYRQRWKIELFFRWLKCLVPCRHWLAESERGGDLPSRSAGSPSSGRSCWRRRWASDPTNGCWNACASTKWAGPRMRNWPQASCARRGRRVANAHCGWRKRPRGRRVPSCRARPPAPPPVAASIAPRSVPARPFSLFATVSRNTIGAARSWQTPSRRSTPRVHPG